MHRCASGTAVAVVVAACMACSDGAVHNKDADACASSTWINNTWSKGKATVITALRNLPTAGACCAACAANEQCYTWTLASNDKPPKCSLKGALTGKLHVGTKRGFTTGTRQAPPSPAPPPHPPADHPWAVFTAAEIKQCGDIRIPELTRTPSRILLFAQCRSANSSRSSTAAGKDRGAPASLKDNMLHAKVISKASHDNGETWSNFTVHTPLGYSHGAALYDSVTRTVVLQYQQHPNADPELNSTYYQRISTDDGLTWGAERDITSMLVGCNPFKPVEMEVESAGSKIQTSSGRLIYTGHSKNNDSCTWYSDDHGETYTSANRFLGNEVSMAELAPGKLIMNGRAGQHPWNPNRTQYTSYDDGTTWSAGRGSDEKLWGITLSKMMEK